MSGYRALGTSNDVTKCELCGKEDLRGTLVLAILDADGNQEEVIYAGSTCGARRLKVKVTALRTAAVVADNRLNRAQEDARERLDYYGTTVDMDTMIKYAKANAHSVKGIEDVRTKLTELITECQQVLTGDITGTRWDR